VFFPLLKIFTFFCLALVAHTCNPSYSGGRDKEDQPWANSSGDTISKKKKKKNQTPATTTKKNTK
jgi:hypothetical protein